MSNLNSIFELIAELLKPEQFKDDSLNGLQIDSGKNQISKIAVAVDAGESVIDEACKNGADLLIVHHGLFWSTPETITGSTARKIKKLMLAGCSLAAYHLPLDANLEVGNGAELARFYGLTNIRAAANYDGMNIGVSAENDASRTLEWFLERSKNMVGALAHPLLLSGGKSEITRVLIATGSGNFALDEAVKGGYDLFISGEARHSAFHFSQENQINLLYAGHYATETFGVSALGAFLERILKLRVFFIDKPSGI
jgi:dinuclear metal center YbgI/SA1388 family protein